MLVTLQPGLVPRLLLVGQSCVLDVKAHGYVGLGSWLTGRTAVGASGIRCPPAVSAGWDAACNRLSLDYLHEAEEAGCLAHP